MSQPSHSVHAPVMADEILSWLDPRAGSIQVDGTLGGGGHARLLAAAVGPAGQVWAFDRDAEAIERTRPALAELPVTCVHASYRQIPEVLHEAGVEKVDGIVLDLGLSSDQLADRHRGFSYDSTGELDMRFDTNLGRPAWHWLRYASEKELANLIYEYGEERFSRRIARRIVAVRRQQPLRTADELATLVRSCVPRSRGHRIDPATRTFQALRIAVNEELEHLQQALERLPDQLATGARLAILSFHSLEDRLVKQAFRQDERLEKLTKKPIRATEDETRHNPRSRSARLRVAQRRPS